jgi:hypothetical protein
MRADGNAHYVALFAMYYNFVRIQDAADHTSYGRWREPRGFGKSVRLWDVLEAREVTN